MDGWWSRSRGAGVAALLGKLAGKNYGWPILSYGRDYRGPRFPASRMARCCELDQRRTSGIRNEE